MGAAVSSNTALKQAISASVGEYGLPRNPKKWKVSHVATWLQQNEMGQLAPAMEEYGVDGQVLLDFEEEDFKEIAKFAPVRRKLMRHVNLLKQRAAEDPAEEFPFTPEDLHRGLQQLNQTMESLVTVLSADKGALPPREVAAGPTAAPAVKPTITKPAVKESASVEKPKAAEKAEQPEKKPEEKKGEQKQGEDKKGEQKKKEETKKEEEETITLEFEIIAAGHLVKGDSYIMGNSSDPYCVVMVAGKEAGGEGKGRTTTKAKSLDPTWNETVSASLKKDAAVTLAVYDQDKGPGRSDDFLGQYSFIFTTAHMDEKMTVKLLQEDGKKPMVGADKKESTLTFQITKS